MIAILDLLGILLVRYIESLASERHSYFMQKRSTLSILVFYFFVCLVSSQAQAKPPSNPDAPAGSDPASVSASAAAATPAPAESPSLLMHPDKTPTDIFHVIGQMQNIKDFGSMTRTCVRGQNLANGKVGASFSKDFNSRSTLEDLEERYRVAVSMKNLGNYEKGLDALSCLAAEEGPHPVPESVSAHDRARYTLQEIYRDGVSDADKESFKAEIDRLKTEAKEGNQQSAFKLGKIYEEGSHGLFPDYRRAADFYELAAQGEDEVMILKAAKFLSEHHQYRRDLLQEAHLFAGDVMENGANVLIEGPIDINIQARNQVRTREIAAKSFSADFARAEKYFKKAAGLKSANGNFAYAAFLKQTRRGNQDALIHQLMLAQGKGAYKARLELAQLSYENRDFRSALDLLRPALKSNNRDFAEQANAKFNYISGAFRAQQLRELSASKDPLKREKIIKLLKEEVDSPFRHSYEHFDAFSKLAEAYAKGEGVEKDLKRADELYADYGVGNGYANMSAYDHAAVIVERAKVASERVPHPDFKEASLLLKRAADKFRDGVAEFRIGMTLLNGNPEFKTQILQNIPGINDKLEPCAAPIEIDSMETKKMAVGYLLRSFNNQWHRNDDEEDEIRLKVAETLDALFKEDPTLGFPHTHKKVSKVVEFQRRNLNE